MDRSVRLELASFFGTTFFVIFFSVGGEQLHAVVLLFSAIHTKNLGE